MPLRFAISSGNWSNAAIWSGSLIPTASDDVYANGFNVTIDQNINVLSISSGTSGSAVNGGNFISTNGISITASRASFGITAGNASNALIITGSHTVYLSGSIRGGTANTRSAVQITNGGTLYVTGSVTGGTVAQNAQGILITSGSAFVRGNIIGGADTGCFGIAIAAGTASVVGDLYSTTNGGPILMTGGGVAQVNVIGNMIVTSNSTQPIGVYNNGNSGGVINYTGIVRGFNNAGISTLSVCTINVTGSVYAGTGAAGISSAVASTINISGSIFASNTIPGLSSTSTSGLVRVTGPLISQNNINAVYSPRIQLLSNSTPYYEIQSDSFGRDVFFYDVAYTSSLPSQTNVRSGSLYGGSNEFSGSMVVPSTSSVRYGVPVDNTTGSATLTPQDIFDFATQNLTGSNTIGARLQNISTTQTTAAIIAAFKGK